MKHTQNVTAIILAAGKGERMKSSLPKVLHELCQRPMIHYVLDQAANAGIKRCVCVLGHKYQEVRKALGPNVESVIQRKQLGTADAVKQAMKTVPRSGTVLVLYGDTPLLKAETIKSLLDHHQRSGASATLLIANVKEPSGYGRIVRDRFSSISAIVEEKDCDEFQKQIHEINTGIVCFEAGRLSQALRKVRPNNRKKEYYLTDCIGILAREGEVVESRLLPDMAESLGVNSRTELAEADAVMRGRIHEEFMKAGVSVVDPASTFISHGVSIGEDTVIYPFTVIEKNVTIGKHCRIGPFAHLRPGTALADEVTAGNFIEISRSTLGPGSRAKHFGFLGDCRIGRSVNIGAGTVTANYDGKNKNITVIRDGAFIGSDTVIIAPVSVGKSGSTGAGSVVTRGTQVPDGATVVGVPARPISRRRKT